MAVLIVAAQVSFAQKQATPPLGWDLTYQTVLNANHVGRDEWIWKWLGPKYESPIKRLLATWKRGPIQSAVLIEMPMPHAGEHATMWLVRTKNRAYYFEFVIDEGRQHTKNEALAMKTYDRFFNEVSSWQQANPVKPEDTPPGGIPGYDGFLSLYDRGNSRQMLLTIEDFAFRSNKNSDDWKLGRLAEALSLLPRFKS